MENADGGGGGNRKQSVGTDQSKPRRTSRAAPAGLTVELPPGPASPSGGKRLSGTIPHTSSRRRSSNLLPSGRRASAAGYRRQKVLLENTYRMEPIIRFRPDHAFNILREVFERRLRDSKYDGKLGQEMAKSLAGEIKLKVKDLRIDRYKYVVVVTVGQRQDTELIIASRCLLDIKCDTYAAYNFANFHIFATGIVYAFYFE